MFNQEIDIKLPHVTLKGNITIPKDAFGFVLFSHGSGSSRHSPRNMYMARTLNDNNIGTLLFDLLTEEEDRTYKNRFNIKLLAERLAAVTKIIAEHPQVKGLPIGYFGSSTGAASALIAASQLGDLVTTIVSRGGRPDLAKEVLHKISAPVLLIVGGLDHQVISLNQFAYQLLSHSPEKELNIIPGATHLFEERGKLTKVAELAIGWYTKYLHAPVLSR